MKTKERDPFDFVDIFDVKNFKKSIKLLKFRSDNKNVDLENRFCFDSL